MPQITILMDRCNLCRLCVRSCPVEILYVESVYDERKLIPTSNQDCLECRACEALCPQEAIFVDI
ncbi:MAG: ferredoxin family protein [Candidatus Heimdallarchaeota archaeon]